MATVAIEPSHLLESRMFSQVLNLYVANTVTHFITSTLSLLCSDRLCDSCVGLQSRANGECSPFQDSRGTIWDAPLLVRESALAADLMGRMGLRQFVVRVDPGPTEALRDGFEHYRCEILDQLQADHALIVWVTEPGAPTRLRFLMLRDRGSQPFQHLEIERVEILRRYIANAWGMLNQRLAARALIDGISVALRNYHRGTLMLDTSLRVVWHNRAARECLELWRGAVRSAVKSGRSIGELPDDIVCVCQRVRDCGLSGSKKSAHQKPQVIRSAVDPCLVATVKLCTTERGGFAAPNILVQFEKPTPVGSLEGKPFVDTLTSGEREVAGLIRSGMSNQEIADRLGKTVVAIKFHLHRIFKKAEVKNRARLMLRLTEVGALPKKSASIH